MKYTVEMASGGMIYMPSLMIGTGVGFTHIESSTNESARTMAATAPIGSHTAMTVYLRHGSRNHS
jgi:hypothetical protein